MSLAPLRVRTIALSVAVLGASLAVPTTLLAAQGPQAPAPDPGQPAAGHQQATPAPPAPAGVPQPVGTGATGPSGDPPNGQGGHAGDGQSASPALRSAPVSAAGATSVSARDNLFAPSAITIQVGDSVTWSNDGQSAHTVTANDGSFDSGNLNSGRSFSYTFRQPGTFAYYCQYHRSLGMKGKVTVTASGSGGGGGGGSQSASASGSASTTGGGASATAPGSESAAGSSPGAAGSSSQLPSTGLPVLPPLAAGFAVLGLGLVVRLRSRSRAD